MTLEKLIQNEIVIMDGAMGTMIQQYKLNEADYRGEQFKDVKEDLKGNNDLLSITQPHIIEEIHYKYLQAGAHIIETNTFNAQAISLADYNMQDLSFEINKAAATCAHNAIKKFQENNSRPCFVAGALGPTNKTLSISPDVNNPGFRAVYFDEIVEAYYNQLKGLHAGKIDIVIIETIFDTLNAKAAIYATKQYFEDNNILLPIMISGTITDNSGRTLSGQTLEAFYTSIEHAEPFSVGLNCALGGKQMRPFIRELSNIAKCYVSAYPNAGLPNAMGEYDETPDMTAANIKEWAEEGWVQIVGGCCGTQPKHIAAIAENVKNIKPKIKEECH